MSDMGRQFAAALARIAELERRIDTMIRVGRITDVDPAKQLYRQTIGGTEEKPQKSPWRPYAQIAGALKLHTPPSVGQQMVLFSPTGDPSQGVGVPYHWSDANPSPSDKGDEHKLTFGQVEVLLKATELMVKIGDAKIDVTTEKLTLSKGDNTEIELKGDSINVRAERVFVVGKVFTGVDAKDEQVAAKVVTLAGPAKQTFAKPE